MEFAARQWADAIRVRTLVVLPLGYLLFPAVQTAVRLAAAYMRAEVVLPSLGVEQQRE